MRRVLFALLTALVLLQSVGVLHRVVHAQQRMGVSQHVDAVGVSDAARVLTAIWGEHRNSVDCKLFDQACPDLLHAPVWALPAVSAEPVWVAAALGERFALFERFYAARGPPVVLL